MKNGVLKWLFFFFLKKGLFYRKIKQLFQELLYELKFGQASFVTKYDLNLFQNWKDS